VVYGFYDWVVSRVLGFIHARLRRSRRVTILEGVKVLVCPGVFDPVIGRTTGFFMGHMLVPRGAQVLELGTGSGAIAAAAALHVGREGRVVATDVNPLAVRCARGTVRLNGVEGRVEVLLGDLFEPVVGRQFDVILFNPPYLARRAGSLLERAWCAGSRYELIERFLAEVREYLNPGGAVQILFSSAAPLGLVLDMMQRYGFRVKVVAQGSILGGLERIYLFKLSPVR